MFLNYYFTKCKISSMDGVSFVQSNIPVNIQKDKMIYGGGQNTPQHLNIKDSKRSKTTQP